MMFKTIYPLLLTLFAINASGELHPFGPTRDLDPIIYLELVGGASMPTFSNTVEVSGSANYNFGYKRGFAVRYQILNKYSVATEFSLLRHDVNYGNDKEYNLKSNHLKMSLPLEIEFSLAPYREMVSDMLLVYVGPFLINHLNSKFKSGEILEELPKSQLPQWDYGVETGVGFKMPVFSEHMRNNLSLKASYYHGMNKSFKLPTDMSSEPAILKSAMLSKSTFARNSGFSFTVIYEFSLKEYNMTTFTAGGNGRTTYDRFVIK